MTKLRRLIWLSFLVSLSICASFLGKESHAQDEDADRGSRTANKQRITPDDELTLKYNAGVFGGTYVQKPKSDVVVDLNIRGRYKLGDHDLDLKFGYERDPFSTKTFNFDDEIQNDQDTRIVQQTDDLIAQMAWRTKWSKAIRSKVRILGAYRFAEFDSDNRWKLLMIPTFAYGKRRGIQLEIEPRAEIRKYPNYFINDRTLDQLGLGANIFGGYRWKKIEIMLGYGLSFTQYDDARYDIQTNGDIDRATASKSYIRQLFEAIAEIKPVRQVRLRLRYRFELADSRNYDRNIEGLAPDSSPQSKFIHDYYDYQRHRINLHFSWNPVDELSFDLSGGFWTRNFANYEARNAENVWLDELRADKFWESNLEIAYRVWTIHGGRKREPTSYLNLVGFVTHEQRISNMKQQMSFATNYTVTRVFAGVEITGL